MKKLFLFAALLMTGFAFYSCEDVVDNPAQDPAQSWNYSVSVKFDNFDLSAAPGGLTYKAPTTLYVLNEENTLMGTITTEAAPAADSKTYATYAGTLTGTIGNNLILATKIGNDLAKQDGTIESAIENGIVQTAEVPIKIYNANSGTLTTAAAKMENTSAIVKFKTNELFAGDKLTFTAKDQAFEITINEEFNPTVDNKLYAAVPATGTDNGDITIAATSKDGFMRGYTLKGETYPVTKGVITDHSAATVPFEKTGVDLTVYHAYMMENDAAYKTNVTNKNNNNLDIDIDDDKSFVITQSGDKPIDYLFIDIEGNKDKDVALTLNHVRLNGEFCGVSIEGGAKFAITLIDENKFERLLLGTPYTKEGEGTWDFNQLCVYGGSLTYEWDAEKQVYKDVKAGYAAEFTIDKDMELKYLYAYNGGTINIADGKKVTLKQENTTVRIQSTGTINVGAGATLKAETTGQDIRVIDIRGGNFNIGKEAHVYANGYKKDIALYVYSHGQNSTNNTSNITMGEKATLELYGGIENSIGQGLYITNAYGGLVTFDLAEGAELKAYGIDNTAAIYCNNYDYRTITEETQVTTTTFNIAKGATVTAEETAEANGLYWVTSNNQEILNITGKGAFEAKSVAGAGMILNGKANITGADVTATGGTDSPAIKTFATTALTLTYSKDSATKLTAKAGTGSTICIADADDKELAKFAEASYTDTTADGVRTITPKAPAE